MPSPFPGMDPFLEDHKFFGDLHGSFQFCIREQLQSRLPAPYFAAISERLIVEVEDRDPRWIESDTDVLRSSRDEDSGGGVAVASATSLHTRSEPMIVNDDEPEAQKFVEIRTRNDDGTEQVITSIEVLRPSNKRPGLGHDRYRQKQREVWMAGVSLVEIDLLRTGEHTTLIDPEKLVRAAPQADYHVCVTAAWNWFQKLLYAFRVEDLLPEVAVPLLPKDGYVALDLQLVFYRCYDSGPYPRRVRYELPLLVPPLKPEQQEWASKLLEPKPAT